ncbi:hypothetical protein [Dokdonia sp. Hel_I_53]|uniref:hypothetical protein n=1 Tax=Dokdonia sp. Hel_I_53 TaxID=1566287 RepID=UPI00119AAA3F|nr:hypothetical protein [Dokdonia sp. Hel_I_53]TVZ52191.1 hypothetical protein OD90_1361 [Dokdonia sp. Hel_I_53]
MKNVFYFLFLIVGISTYGQNTSFEDKYKVEFKFVQEETKEVLLGSIIEIFSGNEGIDVGISDFSGNINFYLKKRKIKHNKIKIKVYGIKCMVHEQKLILKNNLKKTVFLKYGETEYTNRKKLGEFIKKLNFAEPDPFLCGTID